MGFSLLLTARRVCRQSKVPLQNAALAKHRLSGWTSPRFETPDAVICCTMLHKTEISIVASTFFRFLGGRMWTNLKQIYLAISYLQTSAKLLAPDLVAPLSLCRIQNFCTVWALNDIWKVFANSAISKKAVCRFEALFHQSNKIVSWGRFLRGLVKWSNIG